MSFGMESGGPSFEEETIADCSTTAREFDFMNVLLVLCGDVIS
jgi:hypothetical protein